MLTITSLEKEREAKAKEGVALLDATAHTAEEEGRAFTDDEMAAIQTIAKQGQDIQAKIDRLKGADGLRDQLTKLAGSGATDAALAARPERRSMGEQFVQSEEFRSFFSKGLHRTSATWRSPSVEIFDRGQGGLHATTLTTDPAQGGDLIVPQYLPGIQPLLFKRLTVASLLASGTTDSNLISYMVETVFTNAAAAVAEGAAKPESTLQFDLLSEAVRKIAHWLPVTEEMLEDVSQIRSYIDARLRLGVQIAEEDQLLNGSGIAPNILGLMNRPGMKASYVRVDPVTNADALLIQTLAIFYSSFIMPTGYIVNPVNWAAILLSRDGTSGTYLTGGPFSPIQSPTLWGMPVVITPSIVANTALVGSFSTSAQVFRKGGLRVEASNSHQDYFIKNLVAIRAEERLGLAVYRPGAFGKVTGLTGQALLMAREAEEIAGSQGRITSGGEGVGDAEKASEKAGRK